MQPEQELAALQQKEREHLDQIEDLCKRSQDVVADMWTVAKSRIIDYANQVWRRAELGEDLIRDKSEVSSYVRNRYKEKGAVEWALVYISTLLKPLGYTREYDITPSADAEKYSTILSSDQIDVSKALRSDNMVLDDTHSTLVEKKKALQAQVKLYDDQLQTIETEGEKRHLKFSKSPKVDSVNTAKGDPRESESWVALGEHIETLQGVREKLYEFPPAQAEDGIIAKAIRGYNDVFKGFTDLKWTKDIPEWFNVQLTNKAHGKHAAGQRHATILGYETYTDKNGEEKERPILRPLTREQVGDSEETILNYARELCESIPIIAALSQWHAQEIEPKVSQRKKSLSPVLSDKA